MSLPVLDSYSKVRTYANQVLTSAGTGSIEGDELNALVVALAFLSESNDSVAQTVGRPLKDFKTLSGSWSDALLSAVDSGEACVLAPAGTIAIEAPIEITGARAFSLLGAGRKNSAISLVDNQAGILIEGDVQGIVSGLSLLGSGRTATGVHINGGLRFKVQDVFCDDLLYGVRIVKTNREISVPIGAYVMGVEARGCGYGFRVEADGEYTSLIGCQAYGCSNSGVSITTGNVSVLGGTFMENLQGVIVDSTQGQPGASGNPDHGAIVGATINHNHSAGLSLIGIRHGFLATGNNIWATIGNGGNNTSYRRADHTVGLYIEDSRNVNVTGGVIANNRVNIALSGVVTSRIDALLKATPLPSKFNTAYHIREYDGGVNAQNRITITTQGTLAPTVNGEGNPVTTETRSYIPLFDTNSVANQIEVFSDLTPRIKTLTLASGNYEISGETPHVILKTDYNGVAKLLPVRWQQETIINVVQVAAGQSVAVTAVGAPADGIVSTTALATVSGAVVTFWASGRYVMTPTGDGTFIVSSSATRTLRYTPAFQNGWGNLGSNRPLGFWLDAAGMTHFEGMATGGIAGTVICTLPAELRPAQTCFLAANKSEAFGAVQINTNGDVIAKIVNPGDWIGLEGLSFRK